MIFSRFKIIFIANIHFSIALNLLNTGKLPLYLLRKDCIWKEMMG